MLRDPNVVPEVLTEVEQQSVILEHRDDGRRIARSFLKRWKQSIEAEELNSAIDLALCEAASTYNPRFNTKFTTHSFNFIKAAVIRLLDNRSRHSIANLDSEIDCVTAHDAITVETSWTKLSAEESMTANLYHLSPDAILFRKQLKSLGSSICHRLVGLEQLVIRKLYFERQPVAKLAEELGYTRMHLFRIRSKAIERLRKSIY